MSKSQVEWITLVPNVEYKKQNLRKVQVEDHPLKAITVTERIPRRILSSQSSTGRTTPVVSTPTSFIDISAALEGIDPLTKFAIEEVDPLTAIANENLAKAAAGTTSQKSNEKTTESESWESRKISILNQFTTSEKISIVTSFLNDDEQVVVKTQSNSIDKVQSKLEQLDYFEEGSQKKFDLSQVEYIKRIDLLNKELVSAWLSEQRVKSLKIAIQCAKMLSDTEVLQFYPSKFVLITDILDVFGRLVYERLRSKAYYIRPGAKTPTALPQNFTPDMVHETAKETCRNWFYKIASIRELVPRIYVEMAILKSYSFLTSSEYSAALMRITHMIRGIGNPLVSLYARCYLCRVGLTVTTPGKDTSFLMENFYDFLSSHEHLLNRCVMVDLSRQRMQVPSYLTLYTPALDFILSQVAISGGETLLQGILEKCKDIKNSSLVLNTIMSVFKPSYISFRCLSFLDTIIKSNDDDSGFPLHVLLRTLGLCITVHPPPMEDRKRVLAIVWNQISQIRKPDEYLSCVEPWVQYAVQHFMGREGEMNLIIGDIVQHMSADRAHEKYYNQLKVVVERIVNNVQDIEALLAMDNFLPLVDLFHQEVSKVEICKIILSAWNAQQSITDPIIISTIRHMCSVLHDSVNALTIEDDVRQISELVSSMIRKVDYGRDFEAQLTFYVESRGSYSNLCTVLVQLVHCVNELSVKTRAIVSGHHTRKTGAFVRACAAYCFITIPSIALARTRLELYLHSGQVALFNNCLGQADAFFKAALSILHEVNASNSMDGSMAKSSDEFLVSFIRKFLSVLIVVPDSPDKGVLHLSRILLNFIQNYEWQQPATLVELYINVLDMLSAMSQETYPYYVDKVESNDSLYGCDPKFLAELNKISSIVLNELLVKIKEIGPGRMQSLMAQKLICVILNRGDLHSTASMAQIAFHLWDLSNKNTDGKRRSILLPSKIYLKSKFSSGGDELIDQILAKITM